MRHPIPAGDYVEHFDPELTHQRAWLLAVLEPLVAHEPRALEEGRTLRLQPSPARRLKAITACIQSHKRGNHREAWATWPMQLGVISSSRSCPLGLGPEGLAPGLSSLMPS